MFEREELIFYQLSIIDIVPARYVPAWKLGFALWLMVPIALYKLDAALLLLKKRKKTKLSKTNSAFKCTIGYSGFFFGCLIQQQDAQTNSMVFVPNQTQSAEDIRWYWAHGRNALGAGHVSGLGMVHLLLLHLERTQVNWQGEAKQHVYHAHASVCLSSTTSSLPVTLSIWGLL